MDFLSKMPHVFSVKPFVSKTSNKVVTVGTEVTGIRCRIDVTTQRVPSGSGWATERHTILTTERALVDGDQVFLTGDPIGGDGRRWEIADQIPSLSGVQTLYRYRLLG